MSVLWKYRRVIDGYSSYRPIKTKQGNWWKELLQIFCSAILVGACSATLMCSGGKFDMQPCVSYTSSIPQQYQRCCCGNLSAQMRTWLCTTKSEKSATLFWFDSDERCVLRVGVGKRTIAKTLKCGSPNNFREWLQYHAWSRSEKQFGRDKLNKIGLIPHCSSNTRSKMVLQLIQKQPLQVVCSGCWFVRPFFFVADFLFSNWTLPWRTNLYNVGDICIK